MLRKGYDHKGSEKKSLVFIQKGLGAKANWMAVNRQSIVACSYDLEAFNESSYQSKPRL
jgi:hypothetical protein